MLEDRAKTPRTLLIADHLWETFADMAGEMGCEREALLNQALYTFARLNGFLVPSDARRLASGASAAVTSSEPPAPRPGHGLGPSGRASDKPSAPPPQAQPSPVILATLPAGPPPSPDERHPGRPSANAERVAELERQLAAPPPARLSALPPQPPRLQSAVEVDDSLLGDDAPQATSMELPNLVDLGLAKGRVELPGPAGATQEPELTPHPGDAAADSRTLVLLAEGRELDRILKERFLIGRGKHCDLIINSGKVSREHAAITREGSDYFIEDLGSSNGTWHDKKRISRRQIQEGDDYFICAEKLSCTFR